jgi:hypothetical protein
LTVTVDPLIASGPEPPLLRSPRVGVNVAVKLQKRVLESLTRCSACWGGPNCVEILFRAVEKGAEDVADEPRGVSVELIAAEIPRESLFIPHELPPRKPHGVGEPSCVVRRLRVGLAVHGDARDTTGEGGPGRLAILQTRIYIVHQGLVSGCGGVLFIVRSIIIMFGLTAAVGGHFVDEVRVEMSAID